MKKFVFLFLLAFALGQGYAQEIRISSYNLRYDNRGDTGNLWVDRLPIVVELIRYHDFDIIGTQEGLIHQLEGVHKGLPQYEWYGLGRDDAEKKGEFSAIFYKKDKYRLLKKGDFWLSENPAAPGFGWDAKHNRICTWVQLQDLKSKKKFYVFNVHFDHQGKTARVESGKLMLEKIRSIAGNEPVLLTGDFNGDHQSDWYLRIAESEQLKDSYRLASHPYLTTGSSNSFGRRLNHLSVIDHIFVSKHFQVRKWAVLTDSYKGKFPSDHFPVVADLSWKK